MALLTFAFGATQALANNTSVGNPNDTYSVVASDLNPNVGTIQVCVSIYFVSACYTWEVARTVSVPQNVTGKMATDNGSVTLAGFTKEFEGASFSITKDTPLTSCDKALYAYRAGSYTVKGGVATVSLVALK